MQNIKYYSEKFFLLLAGLIVFAHTIIPHDHHPELIHSALDSSYENHNNDNSAPLAHCHAFNLLDAKQDNLCLPQQLAIHSASLFLLAEDNAPLFVCSKDATPLPQLCKNFSPHELITALPLRAPPVS
ncbi:MAG: hypothetical protein ACK5JS_04190 [Mangrovibacterium sp.]